jgi:hypothetical protein
MASVASASRQQEPPVPTTFVVAAGACDTEETSSASLQLANSNDFPEVVICEPQPETSSVATADVTVGPISNNNSVAEVPTSDVAMPQGTLADGVLRVRERPFPPLVLIARVDAVPAPDSSLAIQTPITEFACSAVIALDRPEQQIDTSVAPPVLGVPNEGGETNRDCAGSPTSAASPSSTPVSVATAGNEPIVTPPRGRAQYRPKVEVAPPIASPPVAREVVFATQAFQPVGTRSRRGAGN